MRQSGTERHTHKHNDLIQLIIIIMINPPPYEQVRGGVGPDDLDWDLHLHPSIPCQEETGQF